MIVRAGAPRVAGYDGDDVRLRADGYADRYERPGKRETRAFADWLRPLVGKVDVVMVHNPDLLRIAIAEMQSAPPAEPIVFAVGHTHFPSAERIAPAVTVVNGGTVGGGGTEADPREPGACGWTPGCKRRRRAQVHRTGVRRPGRA